MKKIWKKYGRAVRYFTAFFILGIAPYITGWAYLAAYEFRGNVAYGGECLIPVVSFVLALYLLRKRR